MFIHCLMNGRSLTNMLLCDFIIVQIENKLSLPTWYKLLHTYRYDAQMHMYMQHTHLCWPEDYGKQNNTLYKT